MDQMLKERVAAIAARLKGRVGLMVTAVAVAAVLCVPAVGQVMGNTANASFLENASAAQPRTASSVELVTQERSVPFKVVEVADDSLYEGERRLVSSGMNGLEVLMVREVWDASALVLKTELQALTVIQPVDEVVAVGTKDRCTPSGTYITPAAGVMTSPFGYRASFGRMHEGIDIANRTGTNIIASDAGEVTFVGTQNGYGKLVIVSHGNGAETRYAHCSELLVSKGDKVYQGQHIAEMGNTGRSTGTHLHFEIRLGGEPVDPVKHLENW